MSDKPEPVIVNGDTKSVIKGDTRHPWNQVTLPKQQSAPPTYKYLLTVRHKDNEQLEIKAECHDLEQLFTYHRQFAGIDYTFIKMERFEATKGVG